MLTNNCWVTTKMCLTSCQKLCVEYMLNFNWSTSERANISKLVPYVVVFNGYSTYFWRFPISSLIKAQIWRQDEFSLYIQQIFCVVVDDILNDHIKLTDLNTESFHYIQHGTLNIFVDCLLYLWHKLPYHLVWFIIIIYKSFVAMRSENQLL